MLHQYLRATEIAQFQDACRGIEEEVLWFDISMTDALRMNVCQGTEKLIDVQFDFEYGHGRLQFVKVA